jgi:hypothetical protein
MLQIILQLTQSSRLSTFQVQLQKKKKHFNRFYIEIHKGEIFDRLKIKIVNRSIYLCIIKF